jgi:Putative prokaryotic signal transducing protein
MADTGEKIVLFDSYDSVIQANLTKVKLDAYGIPCFLADENMAGLYPFGPGIFTRARLFVFEQDVERVKEILVEENALPKSGYQCPRCGSQSIDYVERDYDFFEKIGNSVAGVFLGPSLLTVRKVHKCRECKTEL